MNPWPFVKHLFEVYDCGFPDIWMNNLSEKDMLLVFQTLINLCEKEHDPRVWSFERRAHARIDEIIHPERAFGEERIEYFSHTLKGLKINGIELFDVDIYAEYDVLALDYRPGSDWNEDKVLALFQLLRMLQEKFPSVQFSHAEEGCRTHPHPEFAKAFDAFCSETKV